METDDLVLSHFSLIKTIARRYYDRAFFPVDRDDLAQDAALGLIEASRQYDPDRGAEFVTYAWVRMRGAVIEGLYRMSFLPKRQIKKMGCGTIKFFRLTNQDRQTGEDDQDLGDDWSSFSDQGMGVEKVYRRVRASEFAADVRSYVATQVSSSNRYKKAVLRHLLDGLSQEEAALEAGVSRGALKHCVTKVMRQLRAHFYENPSGY